MIFSRTASSDDLIDLGVQDNIISYLQSPNSVKNYSTSILKFWEYSLLLKLVDYYNLKKPHILNVVYNDKDVVLNEILIERKLSITQLEYEEFLNFPIKRNRYDIVCCFGVLEFVDNHYKLLDKITKHVDLNGYIIITTEGILNDTKRDILVDNLITISFFLEQAGYDFCSDDVDLINYTNKSNLHSLVMQRLGN